MKCSSKETTTHTVATGLRPDAVGTRRDASSERSPSRPPARRAWRAAAVLGVALVASLSALQPANAETRRFRDQAGDTGLSADITTVRVSNGPDLVEVAIRPGRVEFGDHFTFWLDTRPKNPGPEYKVGVLPNSDAFGMTRVGAFGQRGTPVPCDDLRATADHFAPAWVSISVPRSCLGDPGKVRVAVKARYVDGDAGIVDWAPARRTFFGWVAP
jgi:hypothetical protein